MPRSGAQHHNAKLSDEQVVQMRTWRERNGWSFSRIASLAGCSIWTARDICEYRTRAFVKPAGVAEREAHGS